jgi:hypothetical protein
MLWERHTSSLGPFKTFELDRGYLLSASVEDWLPSGHLVYSLSVGVDSGDLMSACSNGGDGAQQPPYRPRTMVKGPHGAKASVCSLHLRLQGTFRFETVKDELDWYGDGKAPLGGYNWLMWEC